MKKLLVVPAFLLIFASVAHAQTPAPSPLKLTTSPVVVNLATYPGQSVATDLKVENVGTTTKHLTMGLMKFSASGDTGVPKLMKRQPGDDYFDWVTFSDKTFDLAPNEWKTVKATFNIPKSAAYGYYYAVTFSEQGAKVPTGTATPVTALQGASAILVLLNVQVPGEKPDLTISSFKTAHNFYQFLPVDFNVLVKNTGNIHVVPQGSIFITRPGKNDDLSVISLNQGQGTVLPQTSRLFSPSWLDGFPVYITSTDKNGKTARHLAWNFSEANNFRWGPYTAHLILVYNNGTRDIPIEGTLGFWVIPWTFMLGGLAVLLFVIVGLQATVRKLFVRAKRLTRQK